ncbi:MAG: hypothetical protein NQ082_12085, partial [Stenotrophomonas maltophilia]|nr:hypothetical protein [Stenotrophomonas maltophilia]
SGTYAGAQGEAACEWQQISKGTYPISWQEADGATGVHVDDFACRSGSAGRWPATPVCSNTPATQSMNTRKRGDGVRLRG